MATERLFQSIKAGIMNRASEISEESTSLMRQGRREEAEVKLGEVRQELDRTRVVDTVLADVLGKFKEAGIEQPPVEYLQQIFPSPTTPTVQKEDDRTTQEEGRTSPGAVQGPLTTEEPKIPGTGDGKEGEPVEDQRLPQIHILPNNRIDLGEGIIILTIGEMSFLEQLSAAGAQGRTPEELILGRAEFDTMTKFRTAISGLRKKLGESALEPKFIQVEKVGTKVMRYILAAEIITTPVAERSEVEEAETTIGQSNNLNDPEIYQLAKVLGGSNQGILKEVGINLHPDDLKEIQAILEKLKLLSGIDESAPTAKEVLRRKLLRYAKDKQTTFLANEGNEDAQYLLSVLAPLSSEDQLQKLLPS